MIDLKPLFATDLPPPAVRPGGFPKYNFIGGHNDREIVPVEALAQAALRMIRKEGRDLATYNMAYGSLGHTGLRKFLATKLATKRGIAAPIEDILITSGSLQGLDLVNEVFLDRGDTVVMEELTYSGAISRVRRKGVEVVGVPLDADGIRIDALAGTLEQLRKAGKRVKYIYTVPTIQNPTGSVLPIERRLKMIEISEATGIPIFEDECYADLLWDGEWPTAIRGLPGGEQVIHIGSFSKSLAPALRLGYATASWDVMSRLLACKNDGGTPAIEQMVVADYFTEHFDDHVAKLKQGLQKKLEVVIATLEEQFGTTAEFSRPKGGIVVWVKLPDVVDTTVLAQAALKEGIAFNPGREWSTDSEKTKHHLRICYALPTEQELREGITKLAEICQRETGVPIRRANVGAKT